MITEVGLRVRPAVLSDQDQLSKLIHFSPYNHRHLDWRGPLDWVGIPPFYILESQGLAVAALACPPDPPAIAWIRLFVNDGKIPLEESWKLLWEAAVHDLASTGRFTAAAIVLQTWLAGLLKASGFTSRQSIVMLERDGQLQPEAKLPPGITVRSMIPVDIPSVAEVDASAFDLLWQNSFTALNQAYSQATLATVAEREGQVIGYQLSTRNPIGIHLARLAVRPAAQGGGVGYALLADLIQQAKERGLFHITVNTQSDNATSLALYQKIGFRQTGESYPVYQVEIL